VPVCVLGCACVLTCQKCGVKQGNTSHTAPCTQAAKACQAVDPPHSCATCACSWQRTPDTSKPASHHGARGSQLQCVPLPPSRKSGSASCSRSTMMAATSRPALAVPLLFRSQRWTSRTLPGCVGRPPTYRGNREALAMHTRHQVTGSTGGTVTDSAQPPQQQQQQPQAIIA
jgi:hypothetical protein